MGTIGRRGFLHRSAIIMGAGLFPHPFLSGRRKSKLSFSTLGCPDWSFDKIVSFAKQHGYAGIEWRGIARQMDLTLSNVFSDAAARKLAREKMNQHQLQFVNLGSSATLHFLPGNERDKQLEEGKRYIDLAHDLGCPYIRVFPNNFPKGQEKQKTLEMIISGLDELASFAKGTGVTVLMETHGDLVYVNDLSFIMRSVANSSAGLIWDPCNMWTITKEPPGQVFNELKQYIHHVHVKDAKWEGEKLAYCFLGKGQVPLNEIIGTLLKAKYDGYYSYEWEKLWHPELAEPEVALADFPIAIKEFLND